MSKELDDLSKQYVKNKPTVIRKEISLYRTTIATASATFLREIEYVAKKLKQANITLVAIVLESSDK